MSAIPAYQAATSGQPGNAGAVNQFLGAHACQYVWQAAQTDAVTTSGSISVNTFGQWLAQSFTTASGQTSIGYVVVPLRTATTMGSSLTPTTLSVYADNAATSSAPTGAPLASVTVTAEYAYSSTLNTLQTYLLPVTGLTPSTRYWLVTPAAGTSGNHYNWYKSAATSGALTSPDGVTWTTQTYGHRYQIFDQSTTGLLTGTWIDGGARWTTIGYNATKQPTTWAEYTAGQTAAGYVQAVRTLSYSNGLPTGVA